MVFPVARFTGCFPELFGFVLLDPARLDHALGGNTEGTNLLDVFTTTEQGDRVAHDGIAIPVMGVDAGDYTVLVRHASDRSPWTTPQLSSPGWVLGTETGSLLLCGAGHLTAWAPDHPEHRHVAVPPGWYEVEIRGHLLAQGPDDAAYEFILTSTVTPPAFHADLDQQFGLVNHEH
ncbi:hypothetical protein QLQ12_42165 [Actinoplanes sp. NEAU-A12]|uniref:Uncharacterized protein n=1 Tax=Actinoplanes sandaracinus TaxID=3045177 RepID=A0ABT6WZN1_9ACTN|nr:hypothetical protein [Actinoplanes sandaracinus]MDI6105211.1 hypothetical protein [Actinoplanes sandaracinus]